MIDERETGLSHALTTMRTVSQTDFESTAEKVGGGQFAEAIAEGAGVLATVATGSAIVGGLTSGALRQLMLQIVGDKNTRAFLNAGEAFEHERERRDELVQHLVGALSPLNQKQQEHLAALNEQQKEQFAKAINSIQRDMFNVASAETMMTNLGNRLLERSHQAAGKQADVILRQIADVEQAILGLRRELLDDDAPSASEVPSTRDLIMVAEQFVSPVRDLVRVADDLATLTDLYLGRRPESWDVLQKQVDDIREALGAYNSGWQAVDLNAMDRLLESRALARQLAEPARQVWAAASAFPPGYDLASPNPSEEASAAFEKLNRQWRRQRVLLQARIHRARDILGALENRLVQQALLHREATPAEAVSRAATALVANYVQASEALREMVQVFTRATFADTAELRKTSRPMGPLIEAMNSSYSALEKRSLAYRIELFAGVGSQPALRRTAEALREVEEYQWHRVRPLLNGLLVNIILADRHDLDQDTLEDVRRQQGREWPELALVLKRSQQLTSPAS